MAEEHINRFFVRNDKGFHPYLLKQLQEYFHEQVVTSFSLGVRGMFSKTESGMMYVKGQEGRILISRETDFGQSYIITPNSLLLIEDGGRITYGDDTGFLVLIAE